MTNYFPWIILCGFLLLLGTGLSVYAMMVERKSLFKTGVFLTIPAMVLGAWLIFSISGDMFQKVKETVAPRTGMEIYHALLGMPESDCVEVVNYRDQVIPKLDYAIWLEVRTCPVEMKKVLSAKPYSVEFIKTESKAKRNSDPDWFDLSIMGDSCWSFRNERDAYGNGTYLILSKDSTRLFLKDIGD